MQCTAIPERARAYIAAPVSTGDAFQMALRWSYRHGAAGQPESVAVLVTQAVEQEKRLQLRWLRAQKVSVESGAGDRPLRGHIGPVILYCPDHPAVAAAENLPRQCGVVTIDPDTACLRPWVDAFAPQHLGGQVLEATDPLLPDPTVRRAMVYFTHRLTSAAGRCQQKQLECILGGLQDLHDQGHVFTADELMALALQLNWPGRTAGQLHQMICQAFAAPFR